MRRELLITVQLWPTGTRMDRWVRDVPRVGDTLVVDGTVRDVLRVTFGTSAKREGDRTVKEIDDTRVVVAARD